MDNGCARSRIPQIAFIGAGIMGRPMVQHLLAAGISVIVHSRTRSKAEPLLAAGAGWADTPAAAAENCELLLMNVTDTPDVEAVLFAENGATKTLSNGSAVVDFSTICPNATRRFARRLREKSIELLDAPVTGGQIGAQNATLTIMVGGEKAAYERVLPVLHLLGKKIAHVGPSGAGQALKACNQILCALNMIGVCEALALAKSSGLDLEQAIDTLAGGAGGSWAWSTLGAKIVAGDLQPAFMIKLIQKDLRIVQDAATSLGLDFPGTRLAQELFARVETLCGGGNLGTQAMIKAYE